MLVFYAKLFKSYGVIYEAEANVDGLLQFIGLFMMDYYELYLFPKRN